MTRDHGHAEMRVRLVASLAGLAALGIVALVRGVEGAAGVEILVIGGAFFGGSAVLAARALRRRGKR